MSRDRRRGDVPRRRQAADERSRRRAADERQRSRLRAADLLGLAALGLRGRPLRAILSGAGIALGVATMVSVLGIASSSRAQLIAQIDQLGTNMLTVSPNTQLAGATATLPRQAPAMVRRIPPVLASSAIGDVGANVFVYRNDRIPAANTNGLTVYAAQASLLSTVQGHLAAGRFLNNANIHLPAAVLGAATASALGIDTVTGTTQVWIDRHWFSVVGILRPVTLAPELDDSVLVGFPIAERELRASGAPLELYVRASPATVDAVMSVLPATTDPAAPQNVAVANPADALIARADAAAAFQSLFLALGAVALVVGGVGIANVMVIAVLERRSEIGLRRAVGARRLHVGAQFLVEAACLAGAGGAAGAVLGGFTTTIYAATRHWSAVVPPFALAGAVGVALAVGALAGVYPALRASRLSPAEALRSY